MWQSCAKLKDTLQLPINTSNLKCITFLAKHCFKQEPTKKKQKHFKNIILNFFLVATLKCPAVTICFYLCNTEIPPLFNSLLECTSYSNCFKIELLCKHRICKEIENPNTSIKLKLGLENIYPLKFFKQFKTTYSKATDIN